MQFLYFIIQILLLVNSYANGQQIKKRPNFVLFVADDWGWNNVGYHGNKEVLTPNIDSLANEYLELDRFYAWRECGPSRASLLSGRLPPHVTLFNGENKRHNPKDLLNGYAGISLGMSTIGDKLKGLGYRNVFVGKWDVGFATELHTPLKRGFDRFFGFFDHANDYYDQTIAGNTLMDIAKQSTFYDSDKPPVFINASFFVYNNGDKTTVQNPATLEICKNNFKDLWLDNRPAYGYAETGYLEDSMTQFTLSRIYEHDINVPLFLIHSFHVCHAPLQVPIAWQQPFANITFATRRKYNGMVFYMDTAIGIIVNALKVKKMFDNTLIIIIADNGGMLKYRQGGNNYPLRGGKFSDFEGGIRVNAIAAGGVIPTKMRGKKITGYAQNADLYTTLLDFAGASSEYIVDEKAKRFGLPPIDGISMKDLWTGKTSIPPRNEMFLNSNTLISGKYKIVTGRQIDSNYQAPIYPSENTLQPAPILGINVNESLPLTYGQFNCGKGCLFNIIEDPNETTDLAMTNPEIFNMMLNRLVELNATIFAPDLGTASLMSCGIFSTVWGGFFGPFVPSPDLSKINPA